MRFSHTDRRHPRSTLVAILLLLTLAVTGALAYQAYRAHVSHATIAEQVLWEYSSWSVTTFAKAAQSQLTSWLETSLSPVACEQQPPFSLRFASEDIKALDILRAGAKSRQAKAITAEDLKAVRTIIARGDPSCECTMPSPTTNYFRIDLRTAAAITSGRPIAPATLDRLTRAARNHARDFYVEVSKPALAVIDVGGGASTLFAFVTMHGVTPTDEQAYGFELDADTLDPIFGGVLAHVPLLPASLVKKRPGAGSSDISVWVMDQRGRPIYRSSGKKSPYKAGFLFEDRFSRLQAVVFLMPEAADALVIGGLPRSRLPLLIGLMALTTTLVGVALVQLKRENELMRLRDDFVSSVSHELRTPLAQIRLFSETLLLKRVRSEDEGRRALEIIDQESKRLATLVENVLLFSRSERRVIKLRLEPVMVAPLVTEIVESFAPLARPKQVTIATALDGDAGQCVATLDRNAIRQVLLNLMDNAVKYGPAGQTVTVRLTREGNRLLLGVEDQGPGIPIKHRERIWQPFIRLERDREAAVAGAGIGLSVVRELALLHGGRAWVEAAGGGSRFVVEFAGVRCPDRVAAEAPVPVEAVRS